MKAQNCFTKYRILTARSCNYTSYADACVSVLVDCEWSSWSEWSSCSVSCGHGVQSSSRSIVQPRQYGGRECEGPSHRSRVCTGPDCGKKSYTALGIGLEYCRIRCVYIVYAAAIQYFDYTTVCGTVY